MSTKAVLGRVIALSSTVVCVSQGVVQEGKGGGGGEGGGLPILSDRKQRRVAYPCLKARKARCLRNTEGRAMQRKQG